MHTFEAKAAVLKRLADNDDGKAKEVADAIEDHEAEAVEPRLA